MHNASDEGITYLIASHNRGPFIAECLRSVRQQTDDRWRALIGDDASTDGSREIIAPFLDDRMAMVVNATNVGYIATLQRLIAEARTDIVAILDGDDALAPDATERLLEVYGADADAEFVYSQFAVYDATLTSRVAVHGSAIPAGRTAIAHGVVGAIRSFRRRAYLRTPGLDPAMLYAEDRDLVYKLEEVTRPRFVPAVLYYYRDLPDSQSHDPRKRRIGARNTWRARRAALRRRRMSGIRRAGLEVYAVGDYLGYAWPRLRLLSRVMTGAGRALGALAESGTAE